VCFYLKLAWGYFKTLNKPAAHQTVIHDRTAPVESEKLKIICFPVFARETFLAVTTQTPSEVCFLQREARGKHNIIQGCVKLSTPWGKDLF